MEVICPNAFTCDAKGCMHKKPHTAGQAGLRKCLTHACGIRGYGNIFCVPYKETVTSSVKPSSTSTAEKANTPKGGTTEMKKSLIANLTAATKKTVAKQPEIIKSAAILEGAELLTDRAIALIEPRLPFYLKGFAKHPAFRAIVANVAMVGVELALPDVPDTDMRKQMAAAAAVGSYKEIMDSFNPSEIIDGLFSGEDMKKLIGKAESVKTPKAAPAAKPAKVVAAAAEKK